MNNDPTVPVLSKTVVDRIFPSLCWKAIFGGTVAAIGIHILLTTLGTGAGLATFSPNADNDPVKHFNVGAAVIWSVCALVALLFGGLVAGRFSQSIHTGFVHGILVWSLTLILTLALLSLGTGMILGGAMKAVGGVAGIGANAAASGGKQTADEITSFTDEAIQSIPTNSAPKATVRAKREVGFAVARLFAPENDVNSQTNREALIKALVDTTQMSGADATRTVDDWTNSYNELKGELKQKADVAARNLSCAATWTFFALLIGLLVTGFGGALGAKCAVRHAAKLSERRF
jgi:hypothetical protein